MLEYFCKSFFTRNSKSFPNLPRFEFYHLDSPLLIALFKLITHLKMSTVSKVATYNSKVETTSFKFMTYNINRAVEAEKYKNTCWENREPRIIQMIKNNDPDILCLQECRRLENSDTVDMMYKLKEYKYFTFYANPSVLSLANVIAYKSEKFYCTDIGTSWLSNTPCQCS